VTRGLVGDTNFAVLPNISPRVTFLLTLASQTPPLIYLFLHPNSSTFLSALTLSAYSSFLFGWHVHEKAILLILLPFSLLCIRDRRHFAAYMPLAVAGHVSLFPLLFGAQEWLVKVLYTAVWLTVFWAAFDELAPT
jgi:alpha-1,3-glucosyltransferase